VNLWIKHSGLRIQSYQLTIIHIINREIHISLAELSTKKEKYCGFSQKNVYKYPVCKNVGTPEIDGSLLTGITAISGIAKIKTSYSGFIFTFHRIQSTKKFFFPHST
jgi:hypothetical protein